MLTVITGPPCSGKSTYLRDHAAPGDIAIDYDTLAQALGSPTPHDHNQEIRLVATAARWAAIRAAIQAHLRGHTVWIVDCNPEKRMSAYLVAGADVITLAVDRDELHRRADSERPGLWHELIDRYLAKDTAVTTSRAW